MVKLHWLGPNVPAIMLPQVVDSPLSSITNNPLENHSAQQHGIECYSPILSVGSSALKRAGVSHVEAVSALRTNDPCLDIAIHDSETHSCIPTVIFASQTHGRLYSSIIIQIPRPIVG